VLKGTALFTVWTGHPHRATRDLCLPGFDEPGVAPVRATFEEILRFEVAHDGVQFDLDSLRVGLIREEQEYGGVRVEVIARATAAQVRLRWMSASATRSRNARRLPSAARLPRPPPPRETVVAEKLEAMVQLGMANSLMKDFYDVAALARDYDFARPRQVREITGASLTFYLHRPKS
jgi:hypothetical protein